MSDGHKDIDVIDRPQVPFVVMRRLDVSREREVMTVDQGTTIEGMVGQAFPALQGEQRDMVRVTLNSEVVPQSLWHCIRPKPNAIVALRAVPMGGSGLRMAVMLAVMVAAIALGQWYLGPMLAGSLGVFSATTWGTIATAVTMFAGQLLVNALIPMKTESNASDKQKYSISGAQNTVAPNAPAPLPLGTIRFAPPYAALPYTETVSDEETYFYGIFLCGIGRHSISDIRIGDTPISEYKDVQVETREGLPGDAPLQLITKQVVEEPLQVQLSHDDGPIRRISGGDASELSVDVRFPAGLIAITNKGNRLPVPMQIRIRHRLAGTATWTEVLTWNITRAVSKDFRVSHRWPVLTRGRYEVELYRLTPDYEDSDQIQATCHWVTLRTFRPESPLNMPLPLAMFALRIKASRQLQGMLDNITALVSPIIPDWDVATQTWISRATRNPASIARYIQQGPQCAYPRPDERIDLARLQYWHGYCATNGLYCDTVILEEMKIRDVLNDVCAVGRARPIDRGDKWSVVIDEAQALIKGAISPRNAKEITWSPKYVRYPDAVRVPFKDRSNDFKPAERIVPWIGFEGTPDVVEEWQMPGLTDADAIWRAVRRRMHELMLRPFPFSAMQDVEYLDVEPGDRVLLSHEYLAEEMAQARVVSVHDGLFLTVDEPLVMSEGQTYRVRIHASDGSSRIADVVTQAGERRTIRLRNALSPEPQEGDLVLFGRFGEESVDCVVNYIEPGDDWSATVSLHKHAPELDALAAAETPPLWDGRAGGTVSDGRTPLAPRFQQILSGYEIPDEAAGTVRLVFAPGANDPVPIRSYDLRHREDGDTVWSTLDGVPTSQDIAAYAVGDAVEFQIRATSWDDVDGPWSSIRDYTLLPLAAPGPVIDTFTVDRLPSGLRRYIWTFIDDPALTQPFGVTIRARSGSWASWDDLTPLHTGVITTTPWENSEPAVDGLYTFAIRGEDAEGYAGTPFIIEIETQPAAPVSISGNTSGTNNVISVTMSVALDSGYLRIYRSLVSAAVTTETDVSGLLTAPAGTIVTWTDVNAAESGDPDYRYRARAENAAGVKSLPTIEALP